MRNLVALRILLTAGGVLAATLFALAARYPGVVVAGTAAAGIGILLLNTQSTLMMPLAIELRYGSITLLDTLRHAFTLIGVAVLVVAGASLFAFFAVPVVVGIVTLALTPFLVAGLRAMSPSLDRATAVALLRESLPLALAIAMNVVYLRLLVLLVSLQTDETETGLFATSFRVFEILLGIPTLVLAVALPLLAVAGAEDRERLRYAVQRLTETALALSLLLVLVTVVLADPAIRLLFGDDYADAAPMLQVQAFALLGVFLSQVWTLALVSLRRQRDVAIANGVALVFVIVLGIVLVRAFEGVGGAVAAVATEALLAMLVYGFLLRAGRDAAPSLGFVWRPLLAAAAAALVALLPVSAWLVAPLAAAVFLGVAFAVGAIPPEVLTALRAGRPR
jgi:O-antigen/teichoic acid export membrane protein